MRENHREYYSKKYLQGRGVEFGALHSPLVYDEQKCQVLYADKAIKDDLLSRFPELREVADNLVTVDLLFDLDSHDFSILQKERYDFFIANHIIEHLINPIQFLKGMGDVMSKGAILYLAVPDKEYTFDKNRALTSNGHLWREYTSEENRLSNDHLDDFIINVTKDHMEPGRKAEMYFKNDKVPLNWFKKRKIYRLHRERSIHVHVWNQKSFDEFLDFVFEKLKLDLHIIDRCQSHENPINEMIYILEKG